MQCEADPSDYDELESTSLSSWIIGASPGLQTDPLGQTESYHGVQVQQGVLFLKHAPRLPRCMLVFDTPTKPRYTIPWSRQGYVRGGASTSVAMNSRGCIRQDRVTSWIKDHGTLHSVTCYSVPMSFRGLGRRIPYCCQNDIVRRQASSNKGPRILARIRTVAESMSLRSSARHQLAGRLAPTRGPSGMTTLALQQCPICVSINIG
ncbi:hypothetical protein C8Q74DRAFT_564056 [Fomes fomentarius]|nr:hypothetical protein C8Q74DRAFT_564056 [Fomes fomentarius]